MKQKKIKWPKPEGKLAIYPKIEDGHFVSVDIIGDPDGLRYLASVLLVLAETNEEEMPIPDGEYFHLHIHPECELDSHSASTTICRADAKGTGKLLNPFDK